MATSGHFRPVAICSLSQRPGLKACADVSALEGVSRKDVGFQCVGCCSCGLLSRKPIVPTELFSRRGRLEFGS